MAISGLGVPEVLGEIAGRVALVHRLCGREDRARDVVVLARLYGRVGRVGLLFEGMAVLWIEH